MKTLMFFRQRSPWLLLTYLLFVSVLTFFVAHLPLLALELVGLLALFFQTYGKKSRRLLRRVLILGLAVALANPIFNHRGATVLIEIFGFPITLEAFIVGTRYGLVLSCLLLLTFLWEAWIPGDFWDALGQAGWPRTVFTFRLAVGFLPALNMRYEASRQAQESLAWATDSPLQQVGERLQHVLAWTLEDGMALAQDLNRRGFPLLKAGKFYYPKARRLDGILFAGLALLTGPLLKRLLALESVRFYPVYTPWPPDADLLWTALLLALLLLYPFLCDQFLAQRVKGRRGWGAPF